MNSPKKYVDWEPLNAVPGLRFRHFSGEADYQIRLDIFNATKEINGIDYVLTLEDFKNDAKWTKNYDIYQHLLYVEVEDNGIANQTARSSTVHSACCGRNTGGVALPP